MSPIWATGHQDRRSPAGHPEIRGSRPYRKQAGGPAARRTGRWVALAVTAVTLPIITPNWDVIYYILMLGFFALIGWAKLKVGKVGRSPLEVSLIICDLALLTFLTIVPNPWSNVHWPIGMQFRFDSFIYFFIFLSTATLAYSWRTVLAMGMWTGALGHCRRLGLSAAGNPAPRCRSASGTRSGRIFACSISSTPRRSVLASVSSK